MYERVISTEGRNLLIKKSLSSPLRNNKDYLTLKISPFGRND